MRVYVCYNNYDDSEYYLWKVSTKRPEAVKDYIENQVPSFLSSGQPDVSHLVLVVTSISKEVYNKLTDEATSELDIERILRDIDTDSSTDQIKECDGDINYDLGKFYGLNYKNLTVQDCKDSMSDLFLELDELSNQDSEQYNSIVLRFAKQHFGY